MWSRLLVVALLSPAAACLPSKLVPDRQPSPHLSVSPAAQRCGDPDLAPDAFCVPDRSVEEVLRHGALTIRNVQPPASGTTGVKKVRVELAHPERGKILTYVKWRPAPEGGSGFNNAPRRELAAYALQQLLFPRDEYVVPPTLARCFDLAEYHGALDDPEPTFEGTRCALYTISIWLEGLEGGKDALFDRARMARDEAFRRAITNLNLFTMLVDHGDSHWNNLLVSADGTPRAFVVDNGLAFGGIPNPKVKLGLGDDEDWADALFEAYPKETIERLRALDPDVFDQLGVVVEFAERDGQLVPAPPTAPLDPDEGVRRARGRVQLGLTKDEIADLKTRLANLLQRVDDGELQVF